MPRQGVPRLAEAFVLCPAVLQPLPFRDGHGSYLTVSIAPLTRPALPIPILQASSRCSTSCSSRQPHKPKLLPFAATVAPWAFSPPQTRLPQLHRKCPALRGLTTTFRSDGQTTPPYLQRRLLAPLQSIVRSPSRTSHTIAGRPHIERSSSPRQSVAPSLTHKTPIPLTCAANTSSRTPYGRLLPILNCQKLLILLCQKLTVFIYQNLTITSTSVPSVL